MNVFKDKVRKTSNFAVIKTAPSHHPGEVGDLGQLPGGKDSDLGRSAGLGPEPPGLVPLHQVKDLSVCVRGIRGGGV